MKKIFTLLAAVLAFGSLSAAEVTITWSYNSSAKTLVPEIKGATKGINAENLTLNDTDFLRINGTSTADNVSKTFVRVGTKAEYDWTSQTPTDGQAYVMCPVNVASGYNFKVSEVSIYVGKTGADGLTLNAFYYVPGSADLQKVTLGNSLSLVRLDKNSPVDDNFFFSYNEETANCKLAQAEAFSGESAVVFNLKGTAKLSNTKYWAFSDVVVKGELLQAGEVPDTREPAPISWDGNDVSYKVRDDVSKITLPTLVNEQNVPVTYESSKAEIAEVAEDGTVTLKNTTIGKTVISATYVGSDDSEYKGNTVEYTIEVVTNEVHVNKQYTYEKTTFVLDKMFAAYTEDGNYEAGKLFGDEYLTVLAHSNTSHGGANGNYGGYNFTHSINVRVASYPDDDNEFGNEHYDGNNDPDNSTSLVIEPKSDMTLYVYNRRQVEENKSLSDTNDDVENNIITVNHYYAFGTDDGKALKFEETSDPTTILDKNIYLGAWNGSKEEDYKNAFVISEVKLKAGRQYNAFAVGTTIQVNGVGYILDKIDMPTATLEGEDHNGDEIVLSGSNRTLVLSAAAENHNLYYHFAPAEAPAAVKALAEEGETEAEGPAANMEHDGKTFSLVPAEGIVLSKAGTLSYFAHDPVKNVKSEVKTLAVSGSGETTGIENVAVDAAAEVEYFNLQGIRVVNPENGVFIRRQGNEVKKVVL